MKSEHRSEEEEPPEKVGYLDGLRKSTAAGGLRIIDAASGFLQRLRNRIAPPVEEEDPKRGARRNPSHDADAAAPASAAPPRSHRLRSFLLLVAAVLASGLAGMEFSYSALSKIIQSHELLLDDLRDEIVRYQKQEVRSVNAAARNQKKIEDADMEMKDYLQQIADYEKQVEELRAQLSVANAIAHPTPVQAYGGAAARSKKPVREKSGTCVMGSANAAANLTRCVDQFNR